MIRKQQMNLEQRIQSFSRLGEILSQFGPEHIERNTLIENPVDSFNLLNEAIQLAFIKNPWFTEPNVLYSLSQWSQLLKADAINQWVSDYKLDEVEPKTVAIIMAGNIPLVGFHDFLSVLITGHKALVKQSSNDTILLKAISKILIGLEPEFQHYIVFTEDRLDGFDAVIATGSNNTARYFDYYFGKYPSLIRKNRNSIAILQGDESEEQLEALSDDIFRYYGLGCRNVSKIYVPEDYNFDPFFKAIYKWHHIIHEHKYANNYDYNKAVYLMSEFDMLDNGFVVLKKDEQMASPIATINYESYSSTDTLVKKLASLEEDIQCIVGQGLNKGEIEFGSTQSPSLNTYADNVNTVEFLLTI